MSRILKRTRGSALLAVLVVVLFASLLGGTLLRTATSGKLMAANEYQLQQSYYVAEMGLNGVLSRTDLLDESGTLSRTSYTSGDADEQARLNEMDSWNSDSWTYSVTVTKLPDPYMYRLDSTGNTGYATAVASVLVKLTPLTPDVINSALHFGHIDGPFTFTKTVTSDSQGNRMDVLYHVAGAHVDMYGPLVLDGGHDRTTFNIWGQSPEPPYELYKWWTTNDHEDFISSYPWLAERHEWWDGLREFPNLAMQVYQVLVSRLMPGAYVPKTGGSSNKNFDIWGSAGQTDPVKAEITSIVGVGSTIRGCGLLNIASGQEKYQLALLDLTGDMTIVVDGHLVFQGESSLKTNGHKLTVIAPEHSVTFSSNASGDYKPTWSPYTGDNANEARFYLGNGSIIWAKGHVSVEGVLMPYTRPALDNFQVLIQWVGTDPATKVIADDGWDAPSVGSIGIFSESGSVRFNTIKTRGVVYAGGSLLGYRLRLVGMAALRNPYRPGSAIIGLSQCYITGGPTEGFGGLDLPLYVQQVMARLR